MPNLEIIDQRTDTYPHDHEVYYGGSSNSSPNRRRRKPLVNPNFAAALGKFQSQDVHVDYHYDNAKSKSKAQTWLDDSGFQQSPKMHNLNFTDRFSKIFRFLILEEY